MYAAEQDNKRIVSYSDRSTDVVPNDLCVSSKGNVYFTEPSTHKVWFVPKGGQKTVVYEGITFPNGIRLSPDESLLTVADSRSHSVWSFQVKPDGTLTNGEPFYRLQIPDEGELDANADGMTFDDQGFLYVATRTGIQICDQPGRVVAIIGKPIASRPTNLVFGGPDMQTLYVTAGGQVFSRHLRRKGFHPWQPVMLPRPQV